MDDLSALPAAERARAYRERADMHMRQADLAQAAEARSAHLELAALWTRLAAQADHHVRDEPRSAADGERPELSA